MRFYPTKSFVFITTDNEHIFIDLHTYVIILHNSRPMCVLASITAYVHMSDIKHIWDYI